jgi:SpoVK/Ycf46/Vps4 family AAA+-type ATPase
VLVIEDVDLIAAERGMHGMESTNPLMFQLLNEMDGLAPTEDVLFVLTTNRVEILEPALAARPGRIDHAVEIGLPNAQGRERLLRLYLEGTRHQVSDLSAVVAGSEGVTASFIKELVRRAAYDSLDDPERGPMTEHHLAQALDDLRERSAPIFQILLGRYRASRNPRPQPDLDVVSPSWRVGTGWCERGWPGPRAASRQRLAGVAGGELACAHGQPEYSKVG